MGARAGCHDPSAARAAGACPASRPSADDHAPPRSYLDLERVERRDDGLFRALLGAAACSTNSLAEGVPPLTATFTPRALIVHRVSGPIPVVRRLFSPSCCLATGGVRPGRTGCAWAARLQRVRDPARTRSECQGPATSPTVRVSVNGAASTFHLEPASRPAVRPPLPPSELIMLGAPSSTSGSRSTGPILVAALAERGSRVFQFQTAAPLKTGRSQNLAHPSLFVDSRACRRVQLPGEPR